MSKKKKVNLRLKKKKVVNVKGERKKKSRVGSVGSRYNQVQKILSVYVKGEGIKLGRKFNVYASAIARSNPEVPIKQLEANISTIYASVVVDIEKGKESSSKGLKSFQDDIPWYEFLDALLVDPMFIGVKVGFKFKDSNEIFDFVGSSDELYGYFRANVYRYFRLNFNASPVPSIVIVDTDNKTFVTYGVFGYGEVPEVPKVPEVPEKGVKGAKGKGKEVKLPKVKETEEDKDIRAKAILKALELYEKGLLSSEQLDLILQKLRKGGNV